MSFAAPTARPSLVRRAAAWSDLRWIVVLSGLGLALRLVLGLAVQRHLAGPFVVFNDERFYHHAALRLAEGGPYTAVSGLSTAQWPPAFAFLLSLVYRVTGPDPAAGHALNALLGALAIPLLYLLVRRSFGRTEAVIAATALAILPGQILWNDVLIAETLYALVLLGYFALVAFLPERRWKVVVLGVAIGAAAMTRGEGLLLIPVTLAIWWPELPRRALVARGAALTATAVLALVPWTVRNAVVMHAFVPVSTNSSTTLWSGHNPHAHGAENYAPPSLLRGVPRFDRRREIIEGRILRRKAIHFALHHPGRELELIPLKLLNLNRGDAAVMAWVNAHRPGAPQPVRGRWEPALRVGANLGYYALLAATLGSLSLFGRELWRRPLTRGVLALFVASLVMYGFVYYGNFRYRAPLEPLMLLVAAPLLGLMWRQRRAIAVPAGDAATG